MTSSAGASSRRLAGAGAGAAAGAGTATGGRPCAAAAAEGTGRVSLTNSTSSSSSSSSYSESSATRQAEPEPPSVSAYESESESGTVTTGTGTRARFRAASPGPWATVWPCEASWPCEAAWPCEAPWPRVAAREADSRVVMGVGGARVRPMPASVPPPVLMQPAGGRTVCLMGAAGAAAGFTGAQPGGSRPGVGAAARVVATGAKRLSSLPVEASGCNPGARRGWKEAEAEFAIQLHSGCPKQLEDPRDGWARPSESRGLC